MKKQILLSIISLFFVSTAQAKLFKNAYLSFELPPQWDCQIDGTEWICRSTLGNQAKEAIIILTAKEVSPDDNLVSYENYLKTPKQVSSKGGKPTPSVVKHIKRTQINGLEWVDGLQQGSEIASYYTRYLATVKQQLAVLVTFSAHQLHYTKYSNDFFRAIQSLNVVASGQLLAQQPLAPQAGSESLGVPSGMGVAQPGEMMGSEEMPQEASETGSSKRETMLGIGIVILAIAGFFVMKMLKKQEKNPFQ